MDGSLARHPPLRTMADVAARHEAARGGDPEAMRQAASLTALGIGQPKDWRAAVSLLRQAAEAGSLQARVELDLLGPDAEVVAPPPIQQISASPLIASVPGIASPALCDWLVAQAAPHLTAAAVYEAPEEFRDADGERSNTAAAIRLTEGGLPLLALRERMSALVGVPTEGFETVNVLHYAPGETFSNHYDTFLPENFRTDPDAQRFGHRLFTVVIYLNDDFDGAETDFPLINWRYRGAKGEALLWRNVTQGGEIDRNTLHAGLAPTRGEKWALSQWIRGKRMPMAL
jgi:hypothetical protein